MATQAVSLLIGGAERAANDTFDRINPVTGDVATQAAAASIDDAAAAGDAAAAALESWGRSDPMRGALI